MKVAGIQSDIVWEDPAANFDKLRPWVGAAKAAGASLVVLPEMYACGFSMNAESIAETPGGPSTAFLRHMASGHGVWIAGSVPERQADGRPKNTLIVAAPDGTLTRYAKIHPFTFAGEHEHYDAGTNFVSLTIEGVRVTLFICYDLRFADEFWATANDTDCYVVVANWPKKRREHWTTLLRARSIENQAYVVGINRVGVGGALEYSGDSRIFDPWGEAIAAASMKETMLLADVDPQVVADARTKFPVLKDRR